MPTAVVVDGAFFLRRFKHRYPGLSASDPTDVANGVLWLAASHIAIRTSTDPSSHLSVIGDKTIFDTKWTESTDLYRIFFYDCRPLMKRTQQRISKVALDLARTDPARERLAIHAKLLTIRKVALRLGRLNDKIGWRPKPASVDRWISDPSRFDPQDEDFEIDTVQKGVDMRLGLDVAAMAFKRQVDQIILVATDGDFVPAVKLARREGIDVVLDPMGGNAAKDLVAHVDGVRELERVESK